MQAPPQVISLAVLTLLKSLDARHEQLLLSYHALLKISNLLGELAWVLVLQPSCMQQGHMQTFHRAQQVGCGTTRKKSGGGSLARGKTVQVISMAHTEL